MAFYINKLTGTKEETPTLPAQTHAADIRIVVTERNPKRAYWIDIAPTLWPNTDDVPVAYREIVRGALMDSAKKILAGWLANPLRDKSEISEAALSFDALIANNTSSRMTSEQLVNLFKQSHKYIYHVAPKLTELTGTKLLNYKAGIERMEKRLAKLTGKAPENTLSTADLDNILVNLAIEDLDTPYGEFIASRCEEIRGKLSEQNDAL